MQHIGGFPIEIKTKIRYMLLSYYYKIFNIDDNNNKIVHQNDDHN